MKKEIFVPNNHLEPELPVRIIRHGNFLDLMQSSRPISTECPIQRLDKDTILVKSSGEIKTLRHATSKAQSKESVRQSLQRLRNLINANVTDPRRARWITLTYAENMTDTHRLYRDVKKFIMRFRYKYITRAQDWRYIIAVEPQGRGAWHAHVLFIWEKTAPYIANDDLAAIWRHGFTKIAKLDNVDNIGVYLTAYLGDMDLDDAEKCGVLSATDSVKMVEVDGKSKAIIKGARLQLYPSGLHIYRASRNCVKPDIRRIMLSQRLNNLMRNMLPKFSRGCRVELEDKSSVSYSYFTYKVTKDDRLYWECHPLPCDELPFRDEPQQLALALP